MITSEELKENLHYDPVTGIFTRLHGGGGRFAGSVAGTKSVSGYIYTQVNNKKYLAHRLAFIYMGEDLPKYVDHLNHCRTDNRWQNLRPASRIINNKNQSLRKNNSSGVNGVYWHKQACKWVAQVAVDYKVIHLGSFADKKDAITAREKANIKYNFHQNHGQ